MAATATKTIHKLPEALSTRESTVFTHVLYRGFFTNKGRREDFAYRLTKDQKFAVVETIEELQTQDLQTKLAFMGDLVFLRHNDVYHNGMDGGFVDYPNALVSRFVRLDPTAVVVGSVEITGEVIVPAGKIIECKNDPEGMTIYGAVPEELKRISRKS